MAKSQDVSVKSPRPFDVVIQQMSMTAEMQSDIQSGGTEATIENIILAESLEQMWDADELALIGGRNIIDVEMRVMSIIVRFSKGRTGPDGEDIASKFVDKDGRGMYLLVNSIRLDNGEEFTWNTSAPAVMTKLFWLHEKNMLPMECVIRGTDLGGGQTYLSLKPVPKRAVL